MKIRKIEAAQPKQEVLRVAAYARVSADKDATLRSLSAQVSYYSNYIQSRGEWQYAGVFTDEAATGTTGKRSGFQQMLDECRAGNIDMIITKSVSRFARNTVLTLETVRELREIGVDIFFERENMHTISGDGEFLLTLLASFAQEESRAVSENCKWRVQKKYQAGEIVGLRTMYGYTIEKSVITINKKQAAVVRRIFAMYLDGIGSHRIAKTLQGEKIPTAKNGKWTAPLILSMLRNEKYAGNALLQKEYTADHLSKKIMRNKGEVPQYYHENTHPAIIDAETFGAVQTILKARGDKFNTSNGYANRYVYNNALFCGGCGKPYKRRTVNRKAWWICADKVSGGQCASLRVPESELLSATNEALGLPHFDGSVFTEEVAIITVNENILKFIFKDGTERMSEICKP